MRILIVDIDSLRPDHLGCYGYERDTSPTIDAIADAGVRFEECYASDTPCLPSRTALATCRFGAKTGVVTHFGDGQHYDDPGDGHDPDSERNLAFRQLLEHGIHTATITSFAQRHLAYHFTGSFQEHVQPSAMSGLVADEDADDVTPVAVDWLERHADEDDWLLHVNYWDAHHPYSGIGPFVDAVRESGPPASWPDQDAIDAQRGVTGPRTADLWPTPEAYDNPTFDPLYEDWSFPDDIPDRETVEHLLDGYDAGIRKVDAEIAKLLAVLEREGIREETAIVITGDHGEAFGEHGIYVEHAMAHTACQRVPLVVSWPGVTDGSAGVVDEFVHQFDLVPTICELRDVPVPERWDADAFTPALLGEEFEGREYVVCGHGIYTFGRAVYTDDWVYIRLLHPGAFSHPGLYNDPEMPEGGLELLHDRNREAPTATNLVNERPDVVSDLRAKMAAWQARMIDTDAADGGGIDPLAEMVATADPFLYYDPDALSDLYRELGRSDEQLAAVERCRSFPRE
ncbi:sulfatase [Haladaptatus sp. DYF46]|uniref:sulfatase n=1 Tax=Haladaptatus sp. DYF46 TaxID=2886041 RepID=UPI001E5B7F1E|nr:sulfatase [Haladaptatus sp. DYF46]